MLGATSQRVYKPIKTLHEYMTAMEHISVTVIDCAQQGSEYCVSTMRAGAYYILHRPVIYPVLHRPVIYTVLHRPVIYPVLHRPLIYPVLHRPVMYPVFP